MWEPGMLHSDRMRRGSLMSSGRNKQCWCQPNEVGQEAGSGGVSSLLISCPGINRNRMPPPTRRADFDSASSFSSVAHWCGQTIHSLPYTPFLLQSSLSEALFYRRSSHFGILFSFNRHKPRFGIVHLPQVGWYQIDVKDEVISVPRSGTGSEDQCSWDSDKGGGGWYNVGIIRMPFLERFADDAVAIRVLIPETGNNRPNQPWVGILRMWPILASSPRTTTADPISSVIGMRTRWANRPKWKRAGRSSCNGRNGRRAIMDRWSTI